MSGLVRKNTIPKSVINVKTTVTSPAIEKKVLNIKAFTINVASISAKIARNIVEIIRPVVQTHNSFLKVPYENITNNDENTNHTIVDNK